MVIKPNIYSLLSDTKPIIIARYGDSINFPENTEISFRSAIYNKADLIQIKLQMTSDGHLIVFNESNLECKTNGNGHIGSHTLDYIKALDAGSWFHKKYSSQKILTFEEVLKTFGKEIPLSILIAPGDISGIEASIENLLLQYDSIDDHEIYSSQKQYLRKFSRRNNRITLGYLLDQKNTIESIAFLDEIHSNIIHIDLSLLDDSNIRNLHNNGKIAILNFYGSYYPLDNVLKLGVDGITTNDPLRLFKLINKIY